MLAQHPMTTPSSKPARPRLRWLPLLALAAALALLSGCASTSVRTARDDSGRPIGLHGSVALVEPDIELSELMAGGMAEPRREWTAAARLLYSQAAREALQRQGIASAPDYVLPVDAGPDDPRRQITLLSQAVSMSILQFSRSHGTGPLRNKHGRFDWSLGPGVAALREATGADYALFTYIRDSYASGGRTAMRVAGLLLLGGDIGGGMQIGVASLVDLRTGQVVWHNLLIDQTGDLRNLAGARETTEDLLKGVRSSAAPEPAR